MGNFLRNQAGCLETAMLRGRQPDGQHEERSDVTEEGHVRRKEERAVDCQFSCVLTPERVKRPFLGNHRADPTAAR